MLLYHFSLAYSIWLVSGGYFYCTKFKMMSDRQKRRSNQGKRRETHAGEIGARKIMARYSLAPVSL
jgi:hypothetical protein